MKPSWFTIALCLEASDKKYFRVLIDAVGDLMSPLIYLLCKYPLTTIINFNLSIIKSDYVFTLFKSMHIVTGSPLPGSLIRKL